MKGFKESVLASIEQYGEKDHKYVKIFFSLFDFTNQDSLNDDSFVCITGNSFTQINSIYKPLQTYYESHMNEDDPLPTLTKLATDYLKYLNLDECSSQTKNLLKIRGKPLHENEPKPKIFKYNEGSIHDNREILSGLNKGSTSDEVMKWFRDYEGGKFAQFAEVLNIDGATLFRQSKKDIFDNLKDFIEKSEDPYKFKFLTTEWCNILKIK